MHVYRLYDESRIAPVFNYKDSQNIIIDTKGETTYVPYIK